MRLSTRQTRNADQPPTPASTDFSVSNISASCTVQQTINAILDFECHFSIMPPATPTASGPSTRGNAKRASASNNDSTTRSKRVKVEQPAESNPEPEEQDKSNERDEGAEDDAEDDATGNVLPTSKQILQGIFDKRIGLIAEALSARLRERAQAQLGLFEPLDTPLPQIDSNGKAIEYTLSSWKRKLEEENETTDLITSKKSRVVPTDVKDAQAALVDLERTKQSRREINRAIHLTSFFEKDLIAQAREVSSQYTAFLMNYDILLEKEVTMFTSGIDRYTRRF
ncbi:hypothetical protein D6D23_06888 [Aureobasidium pullulans]|uniref:Uncharacterized protein n=1 Tax=Aureobasidium pullulans TaxID=5580 RepID=A0A4V4ICR4_AURPU|nr:hypothetical protein D6D23_06888 [Aureobasidium pullulans]THW56882.1 hypothetical protein D6D20_08397 [Aureobasidium pullulans]THZ93408.1 hypothetical protein D6C82_08883 [Aureobasidium pullulans]